MNTSFITEVPTEAFLITEPEVKLPTMKVLQDILRVAYPEDSEEEIKKMVSRA